MLTYNEQSWLAWKKRISRAKNVSAAWCHKCPQHGRDAAGCYGEPYCPLFPDWQDALEFEGRVVAKLANIHFGTEYCEYCSSHIRVHEYCGECHTADDSKHCQDCRLKAALLQVEEEMDGTD